MLLLNCIIYQSKITENSNSNQSCHLSPSVFNKIYILNKSRKLNMNEINLLPLQSQPYTKQPLFLLTYWPFSKRVQFHLLYFESEILQIPSSDVFIPSLCHYTEVAKTLVGKAMCVLKGTLDSVSLIPIPVMTAMM